MGREDGEGLSRVREVEISQGWEGEEGWCMCSASGFADQHRSMLYSSPPTETGRQGPSSAWVGTVSSSGSLELSQADT